MVNRSFARLFWSQAFANIGDVLYVMALIALLYERETTVFVVSLIPFFITMSKFSFGIVAPLVIDRFPLLRLLQATQLLKVLIFSILFGSLLLYDVPVVFILFAVALLGIVDGLQEPVSQALVPSLVEEEERVEANSLLAIQFQMTDLLTWSLGAVLVAFLGAKIALAFTLVGYMIALILAYRIHVHSRFVENVETIHTVTSSLLEGWRILVQDRVLRHFLWMNITKGLVYPLWVASILYVFVDEVYGRGEEWWGYLNGFRIVGAMLGGWLMYRFAKRLESRLVEWLVFATISIASITFLFGWNTSALIALVLVFLLGLPEQTVEVTRTTLTQQRVQEQQLAKVYTAQSMIYYFVFSLSVLVIGALVDRYAVQTVFIGVSFLLFSNVFISLHLQHVYDEEKNRL